MDCIILAGGRPAPGDPLYAFTNGKPKALLEVKGRTMLEWVTTALHNSTSIDEIVVVGIEEAETEGLHFVGPTHFLPNQGGLVPNALAGVQWITEQRPGVREILVSSSDIPMLTSEMVDAFVERCRPFDYLVYYNVVTRATMERTFPNSRRTFVRLRDVEVAGGDLVVTRTDVLDTDPAIWQALADARKHAWRLAWQVGPRALYRLLTRRLSLSEAETLAGRLLGQPVKVVQSDSPELGMDVDKPHHLELLRHHLPEENGSARITVPL